MLNGAFCREVDEVVVCVYASACSGWSWGLGLLKRDSPGVRRKELPRCWFEEEEGGGEIPRFPIEKAWVGEASAELYNVGRKRLSKQKLH